MSSCSRFLVIVLLVLSLPVQAFAVVSMKYAAVPVSAGLSAPPHAKQDARLTASAHCHESLDAALAGDDHRHGHGDRDTHRAHTCTTCASCLGAALPAAPIEPFPADGTRMTLTRSPGAAAVSFLTAGIERPPRTPLV